MLLTGDGEDSDDDGEGERPNQSWDGVEVVSKQLN